MSLEVGGTFAHFGEIYQWNWIWQQSLRPCPEAMGGVKPMKFGYYEDKLIVCWCPNFHIDHTSGYGARRTIVRAPSSVISGKQSSSDRIWQQSLGACHKVTGGDRTMKFGYDGDKLIVRWCANFQNYRLRNFGARGAGIRDICCVIPSKQKFLDRIWQQSLEVYAKAMPVHRTMKFWYNGDELIVSWHSKSRIDQTIGYGARGAEVKGIGCVIFRWTVILGSDLATNFWGLFWSNGPAHRYEIKTWWGGTICLSNPRFSIVMTPYALWSSVVRRKQ